MDVPFIKYTAFGNNFIIVDEIRGALLTEEEKRSFAYFATNQHFGIGSDNLLVIQPFSLTLIDEINAYSNYWKTRPEIRDADYIFRMFEPDGKEAFCCGNGLMSIADYLRQTYSVESSKIITEIPTGSPRMTIIGSDPGSGNSWVNLGDPRKAPKEIAPDVVRQKFDEDIDRIGDIRLEKFRETDAVLFFNNRTSVSLDGYLVFTGEPHLVILTDQCASIPNLTNILFPNSPPGLGWKRKGASSDLLNFIGNYFARVHTSMFPCGINVDFVRYLEQSRILEYRCFERGINKETLACGTGALASAFVAKRLGLIDGDRITLWPHHCRWFKEDAEIIVAKTDLGWVLQGKPSPLCEGVFKFQEDGRGDYALLHADPFCSGALPGGPMSLSAFE